MKCLVVSRRYVPETQPGRNGNGGVRLQSTSDTTAIVSVYGKKKLNYFRKYDIFKQRYLSYKSVIRLLNYTYWYGTLRTSQTRTWPFICEQIDTSTRQTAKVCIHKLQALHSALKNVSPFYKERGFNLPSIFARRQ